MATVNSEPGYYGNELISLGGMIATHNRGRKIETWSIAYNTPYFNILSANGNRISAIINNALSPGQTLFLVFGEALVGTDYFPLLPGQSLQIDKDFPWTGMVNGVGTGASFVYVTESSIP